MSSEWMGPAAQLIGTFGKIGSGIAASSASSRQAKIAADQVIANSRVGIRQTRRQALITEGKQRAITAGAGLVMEGTPLEVMLDSANQAQLSIELQRRNAQIEAENIKQRGAAARAAALGTVTQGFGDLSIFAQKNETLLNELWRKATGGAENPYDIHDRDMAGIYGP